MAPSLQTDSTILFVQENKTNILLFQKQLHKDFDSPTSIFPANFLEEIIDFNLIVNCVRSNLIQVLEQGETKLLQLLYKVDIPEKEFLKLLSQENFVEELVTKILIREAQKIYFRVTYSK